MAFSERGDCRLCGTPVDTAVPFKATPPANGLVEAGQARPEPIPLELRMCTNDACRHVQLGHVVDPQGLFGEYRFETATCDELRRWHPAVRHFDDLAGSLISGYGKDPLYVDVGSNDSTLLRCLRQRGAEKLVGVEPSGLGRAEGVFLVSEFMSDDVADRIVDRHGRADVVTANNVLAHVDDLDGIIRSMKRMMHRDSVLVFEVSYLGAVVERTLFDTVYHEHLDYHALAPLTAFLAGHGLSVFDAELTRPHGGSIRLWCGSMGRVEPGASVAAIISAEDETCLNRFSTMARFWDRRDQICERIHETVARAGRVAGFGAAAKATTMISEADLGGYIAYVVDDTPRKQGRYMPGCDAQVVPRAEWADTDSTVIFAWNYADPVMERYPERKWIIPLPQCYTTSS